MQSAQTHETPLTLLDSRLTWHVLMLTAAVSQFNPAVQRQAVGWLQNWVCSLSNTVGLQLMLKALSHRLPLAAVPLPARGEDWLQWFKRVTQQYRYELLMPNTTARGTQRRQPPAMATSCPASQMADRCHP